MSTALKGSLEEAYDAVPYTGQCYAQTHPAHMAMLGRLFGLNPPDFRKARVLELGCAAGGNLAPVALSYPGTECIGLDFSATEIEEANKLKAFAGLKNVTFLQQDIMNFDLAKNQQSFDYIICHGVYSWVPPAVAARALEICSACLKPDGLAFISYNALPGWNSVRSVRDILMHHATRFDKPEDKLREARAFLGFMADNLSKNTAFGQAVDAERNMLGDRDDYYIYHDHLSAENFQFYFRDFMRMAGQQGLAYVGEGFVQNMFYDSKPQPIIDFLNGFPDAIEREQHLDYITNRRFRMTVLCRDTQKPDRAPDGNRLRDFHFLLSKQGKAHAFSDPLAAALFSELAQAHKPVAAAELVEAVRAKDGTKDPAKLWSILLAEGWKLVKRGMLNLYAGGAPCADAMPAKPHVSPIARYQAGSKDCKQVTNLLGQQIPTGGITNLILKQFDGTRTVEKVTENVADLLRNKVIFKKDLVPTDKKAVRAEAAKLVQDIAHGGLKNCLLMP